MKVLQVSNGYPPKDIGGIQEYVKSISKALTNKHKVIVFAREWDYSKNNYLINSKTDGKIIVKTVVNNISYPPNFENSYKNSTIDEFFKNILIKHKPDLIHFHHLLGLSGNLPNIAKNFKIPYLITLHDYWFICPCIRLFTRNNKTCPGSNPQCVIDYHYNYPAEMTNIFSWSPLFLKQLIPIRIKREIKSIFVDFYRNRNIDKQISIDVAQGLMDNRSKFFRTILNSANILISPSEFVKNRYREFGINKKIVIFPHGTHIKKLSINNKISNKNNKHALIFAYLGTLFHFKGVHVLIKAFKVLNNPLVTLFIYGDSRADPSYFRKLKKLVGRRNNIFFKGVYKHEDLTTILSNIDVVVIPSLCPESFNLVAHESQAAGVPIIASKIGALTEMIEDNVNGFLFRTGDVNNLQAKMLSIVKNPKILKMFSLQAKYPISLKGHVSKLEKIYFNIQN